MIFTGPRVDQPEPLLQNTYFIVLLNLGLIYNEVELGKNVIRVIKRSETDPGIPCLGFVNAE